VKRGRTGHHFTFVEVLAAMIVTAIVLPVAVRGVLVASRASQVGLRKETALRLADATLNRIVLTEEWREMEPTGQFEDRPAYRWELVTEDWMVDDDLDTSMTLLTLVVYFPMQHRELSVHASTLVAGGEE